MKKLLLCLLLICLIGCSNKTFDNNTNLRFEISGDMKMLYEFSDDSKLYSIYSDNHYTKTNGYEINLDKALNQNLITIDEIIEQTDVVDGLNDGGTNEYQLL